MTLQFRVPGPLGIVPGTGGQRLPGPLNYTPGVYLGPNQPSSAPKRPALLKRLMMPPPAADSRTKVARDIEWNLFSDKGAPALTDVIQGGLANCPLASLLAALAFTSAGQRHLLGMVTEHKDTVETDLSGVADELEEKIDKIVTGRYFTVKLVSKSFEVSSVLYTDEARDPNPIYMTSPNQVLWPCLIEKAFAAKVGGYEGLNDPNKLSANTIWETITGSKPDGFEVTAKTPPAKIQGVAKNANRTPTIAASKDDATAVTGWHGFTVLGLKGSKIELYDPMEAERKTLSLPNFIKNFKAILYEKS